MTNLQALRSVGIEAMHAYLGPAYLDIRTLFERRGLNLERYDNLMMHQKSVALPCEDAVSNAVNAARPIVDALNEEERGRIEWLITGTESGLDFGKSLATYVHEFLGLPRTCRLFETKQACYAGTATLQMAAGAIASGISPGAKALVIATDLAQWRAGLGEETGMRADDYAEPSMGTGAVALLISDRPELFAFDLGAFGLHSYEVCDSCRPVVGAETGDADLSLLTYMDCAEGAFVDYQSRVESADYQNTFAYLAYHTPFAGLVRSVHRKLMRKFKRAEFDEIEADFEKRVAASLKYCTRVGNIYSATTFLALCGVIDRAVPGTRHRVGLFSYGSGCASEFYSGVVAANAGEKLRKLGIDEALDARYGLTFEEYEALLAENRRWGFGARDQVVDIGPHAAAYDQAFRGKGLLTLKEVRGFHRQYDWS
jgi:polyketide biosynthesis 3-hydroxy-3-methylglutaryl-CoA synthase-like enzyme PksG